MRPLFFGLVVSILFLGVTGSVEAGATQGAQQRSTTVQAFRGVAYKMAFKPGQAAVVTVEGDGDTDLGVVIYDSRGKRITTLKIGERPSIRWTPTSAEPYQIRIYNRGGVPNRFALRTN